MKNFFRSIPWKNILLITLVTTLAIGAIVGIGKAVKTEEKTISPLVFERGALDPYGVYVDTKKSIVTKDLIECQGLRIEPDFEATGKFQVFYYRSDKTFAGSTEVMRSIDGAYEKDDTFGMAKYCRIVITPDAPKDDDGVVDTDFEIAFYQVIGFANDFTITVYKEQKFDATNLLEKSVACSNDMALEFLPGDGTVSDSFDFVSETGYSCYEFIDITGIKQLGLDCGSDSGLVYVFHTGTLTSSGGYKDIEMISFNDFDGKTVIDVPAGAIYLTISCKTGAEIGFYKLS